MKTFNLKRRDFLKYTPAMMMGPVFFQMGEQQSFIQKESKGPVAAITETDLNLMGSYGSWADGFRGTGPGRLSFRNPAFTDVQRWKQVALRKVEALLSGPKVSEIPEVKVLDRYLYDGLEIEKWLWQLPYGPPTEAYFLRPGNVKGPLPGILGLHDHGGNKFFGKRKIVNTSDQKHPMLQEAQKFYYGSRAWANEIAKRGYAVLVPDTFTFESRKVLLKEVPEEIRSGVTDVEPDENTDDIKKYNRWAANYEHILAKSLFCAGLTWPGVFLSDDQVALSILSANSAVDSERLGCCGLSGGGLRSLILSGMDSRIKAGVCVGMMSTWSDLLLNHSWTHTWMMFIPHLAMEMDYSEIFSLQLPAPRMVLNNIDDGLFDLGEMKKANTILREAYEKAGKPENYVCEFYPGIHKFDIDMQESAFDWLDHCLKK